MIKRAYLLALVPLLLHAGLASAQEHYPVMEKMAQKVVQKYQTSSCQDEKPAPNRETGADRAARRGSAAQRSADADGVH